MGSPSDQCCAAAACSAPDSTCCQPAAHTADSGQGMSSQPAAGMSCHGAEIASPSQHPCAGCCQRCLLAAGRWWSEAQASEVGRSWRKDSMSKRVDETVGHLRPLGTAPEKKTEGWSDPSRSVGVQAQQPCRHSWRSCSSCPSSDAAWLEGRSFQRQESLTPPGWETVVALATSHPKSPRRQTLSSHGSAMRRAKPRQQPWQPPILQWCQCGDFDGA